MSKGKKQLSLGLNLEDYRYDARHCTGQTLCRWIDLNYVQGQDFAERCPTWQKEGFDVYGAVGKCNIVYYLLNGKLDYSDPTVRDIAYRDLLCGSCDVACKRNLDYEIQLMLESLRAKLVENSNGPMPQHIEPTKNIENTRNFYGKDQSQRLNWIPKNVKVAAKADILFFVGCRPAFSDTQIAVGTARILNAAKADFMVLKDEPCCGHFLFSTGQMQKARKLAQDNIKSIRQTGAKTVVFSCPGCYKTFKVDYPKLLGFATSDLGFEVKHITELADQWVNEGRLKFKNRIDMKVTYHDPCNLGRLSEPWVPWKGVREDWGVFNPPRFVRRGVHGVYEPPRNILKAIPGIELAEMVRHHENAWCCGNEGGVKEAFPDLALWTASERLREAASTGAEAIICACPACKENFKDAAKNGMKVYDVTELIAKAIGK
jgi:Fe-S oxidoreductase